MTGKASKENWLETLWQPFLQRVEKSRLRRAKSLVRQGAVRQIRVSAHTVTAVVKSGGGPVADCKVEIPVMGWWADFFEDIALWLARRPDWFASLFAGVWDEGFLHIVREAGLEWAPAPSEWDAYAQACRCTCRDNAELCIHVTACVIYMITTTQQHPLSGFSYVGISSEPLLERTKQRSAQLIGGEQPLDTGTISLEKTAWTEEELFVWGQNRLDEHIQTPHLIPTLKTEKWQEWRKAQLPR